MITVIFQSSHISGLDSREFKTMKEAKVFVKDKEDEICSPGDAREYFIVEDAKSVQKGDIDKT